MKRMHCGRCLCGGVTFEITTCTPSCVNCHCESCRRQCSSPMTTYIGVPDGQWRWSGSLPKVFHSPPWVERSFCENCGTPMSFRSRKMSDVMHFYLAALENPALFQPTMHVAYEEKLSWLNV
ncbi:MAG: GFA family protein [Acidiferrobacterales bacterium]|nr:GFA family protein [Acidiferrobacterales bacterium]